MSHIEQLPDEVPVADAIEQNRDAGEPRDDTLTYEQRQTPPLEATPADWQEQLETVDIDSEEGMDHE